MVTTTNADKGINMADPTKVAADEIRKEFSAQSDHDLIMWKSANCSEGFKTVTEHVKEVADEFVKNLPF